MRDKEYATTSKAQVDDIYWVHSIIPAQASTYAVRAVKDGEIELKQVLFWALVEWKVRDKAIAVDGYRVLQLLIPVATAWNGTNSRLDLAQDVRIMGYATKDELDGAGPCRRDVWIEMTAKHIKKMI